MLFILQLAVALLLPAVLVAFFALACALCVEYIKDAPDWMEEFLDYFSPEDDSEENEEN